MSNLIPNIARLIPVISGNAAPKKGNGMAKKSNKSSFVSVFVRNLFNFLN
jgi:hypothetical protein